MARNPVGESWKKATSSNPSALRISNTDDTDGRVSPEWARLVRAPVYRPADERASAGLIASPRRSERDDRAVAAGGARGALDGEVAGLETMRLLLAQPDWVHRRVDALEYRDSTTFRRRQSVHFTVPDAAPELAIGRTTARLVP